jgi:caffeoyl-CoA O-methyltransferase
VSFIVREEIDDYAAAHTTPPPEHLKELAEETRATLRSPQMLTGTIEGRFLELLVHGLQARRVLELGTYSGYSSLSMAAGLPEGGHIDTCEFDERHAEVARRHIAASPYADRIELVVGDARESLELQEGPFDVVFVDAWKTDYPAYFEAVLPKLAPHGVIVADNVFRWGTVLAEGSADEEAVVLRRFNDDIRADPRVDCAMLTVGDGLLLIWRR